MKGYVNYFDTDAARARANFQTEDIWDGAVVVQFSPTPDHLKMDLAEAQNLCDSLNRADVHSVKWPEHRCHFEAEEIAQDEFAVVCKSHPEFGV